MELTSKTIILAVTLILGQITKKLGWVRKRYIPIQNLVIGVISGVICWLCELDTNIFVSIIKCVITSYAAGGLYDGLTINTSEIELEYEQETGDEDAED